MFLVKFENALIGSHTAKLLLTRQHRTPLLMMAQWKIEETPVPVKIPTDATFKKTSR